MGLVIIHFLQWHTSGPLPADIHNHLFQSPLDYVLYDLAKFLISYKFFAIFSFVYGLSFYLQTGHNDSISDFGLRILLLLYFGIIHHILWRGDILIIYAPVAIILYLMRNKSNFIVLVLSILCILNIPGFLLKAYLSYPDSASIMHHYDNVIENGTFYEVALFNISSTLDKIIFQLKSGRIFITLGYFLLGLYVGRKKWHKLLLEDKPKIFNIFKYSGLILLGLLGLHHGLKFKNIYSIQLENTVMTIFIISSLAYCYYYARLRNILNVFTPVGKMSLSIYIMQTIFGIILFYNVGFDLYGESSVSFNLSVAVGFYIFQLIFSHLWLSFFNYGILEWIWRSAYKKQFQPLLKGESDEKMLPTGVELADSK